MSVLALSIFNFSPRLRPGPDTMPFTPTTHRLSTPLRLGKGGTLGPDIVPSTSTTPPMYAAEAR